MKIRTKKYLIIICVQFLFMLLLAGVMCLAAYIQFIGRECIGRTSGMIFSGDIYRYHYLAYAAGVVIYWACAVVLYKLMMRPFVMELLEFSTGGKVFFCVLYVLWAAGTFIALVFLMFVLLGLTDSMSPGLAFAATVCGWPSLSLALLWGDVINQMRIDEKSKEKKDGKNIHRIRNQK